jgi:hypothetical protein
MAVSSCPKAKILPESGFTRPSAVFEQHGFAAAGGAQNDPRFALERLERDVRKRRHAVERHGDVFKAQDGVRRLGTSGRACQTKTW